MDSSKNRHTKRIDKSERKSEPLGDMLTLVFSFKYKGTSELGPTVGDLELPIALRHSDRDTRKKERP